MKLASFQEIAEAENGQQIPSFQGTIKKVFDQKNDVGQYGQWWLQNIILQDERANEITVTWCCEDAWSPDTEGETWLFESGRDKKGQLVGLKKEIRNKNGKHYESVKVDDRAKVKVIGGDATLTNTCATQKTQASIGSNAAPTVQSLGAAEYDSRDTRNPLFDPSVPSIRSMRSTLDERQRAIIRQHSQSMALEVLKLKVQLNELTVEDLTPSKLRQLADYFDDDVFIGATQ